MTVETNVVQRAVQSITLGTISAFDQRRSADWEGALDEYDQQFRIDFRAIVNYRLIWVPVSVRFDVSFVDEPYRQSPYGITPQFTFGWEHVGVRDNLAGPDGLESQPVMVTCCVTGWSRNDDGTACTGASLAIGMCNPGVRKNVLGAGKIHLNFEGYAAPRTEELLAEEPE
jgi:hypothetical protein